MRSSFSRERQPDAEEDGLASSPLKAVRSSLSLGEKQEDADNQKNSTRASQAGLNSNTVHIPVTITAPPGETTIIPSEYKECGGFRDKFSFECFSWPFYLNMTIWQKLSFTVPGLLSL